MRYIDEDGDVVWRHHPDRLSSYEMTMRTFDEFDACRRNCRVRQAAAPTPRFRDATRLRICYDGRLRD
jgi:hypothetical protein